MSAIRVETEFVVRTEKADRVITAHVAKLQAEMAKLRTTGFELAVRLKPPDVSAIQRMVRHFQSNPIDIPVRFVPQGSFTRPGVSPDASSRMSGSSMASGSMGYLAMTNGRPGVNPQGFAGQQAAAAGAVNQQISGNPAAGLRLDGTDIAAAIGKAIMSAGQHVADEISEAFSFGAQDIQRAGTAFGPKGGGRAGRAPEPGPSNAEVLVNRNRMERATDKRELRSAKERAYWRDSGENGGGYDAGWTRPSVDARGRRLDTYERPSGNNPAPGGRSGKGGGDGFSALRGYMMGGSGILLAAHAAGAYSDYANAGFGMRRPNRDLAQEQALQSGLQSIPLFGTAAMAGADLLSPSTRAATDYTLRQAELQNQMGAQVIASRSAVNQSKLFNPREVIAERFSEQRSQLDYELASDDKYRRADNGKLNSAGELHQVITSKRLAAEEKRALRDAGIQESADFQMILAEGTASGRRSRVYGQQASYTYGRSEQLADATGGIDDDLARKKAGLYADLNSGDPVAAGRAKMQVQDATAEADAQRLAKAARLKREWAEQDKDIVAETEAAKAQALGQSGKAEEIIFKRTQEKKTAFLDDEVEKQKQIALNAAQAQARAYEKTLDVVMTKEQAQLIRGRVMGNEYQTQVDVIRARTKRAVDAELSDEGKAAAQAMGDAQIDELSQGRGFSLSRLQTDTDTTRMRTRGQHQRAAARDLRQQALEEITAAGGDPTKLPMVIENIRARIESMKMQATPSQMFGSAVEYANSRLTQVMSEDGSGRKDLQSLEDLLKNFMNPTQKAASNLEASTKMLKESLEVIR